MYGCIRLYILHDHIHGVQSQCSLDVLHNYRMNFQMYTSIKTSITEVVHATKVRRKLADLDVHKQRESKPLALVIDFCIAATNVIPGVSVIEATNLTLL